MLQHVKKPPFVIFYCLYYSCEIIRQISHITHDNNTFFKHLQNERIQTYHKYIENKGQKINKKYNTSIYNYGSSSKTRLFDGFDFKLKSS